MGHGKRYDYVIFDADLTLLEFNEDERRAFRAAFSRAGVSVTEEDIESCRKLSDDNWASLGLNDVHLPEMQQTYHERYRKHVSTLFDRLQTIYPLGTSRKEAEEEFMNTLQFPSHTVSGAEETVRALSEKYRVCIATNGLTALQNGRLTAFAPFLYRVFISEELGVIKPDPVFFRRVLKELNVSAEKCLMVGDSLSSDIAGANAVNMDCVWFNRKKIPRPEGVRITAEIECLTKLKEML